MYSLILAFVLGLLVAGFFQESRVSQPRVSKGGSIALAVVALLIFVVGFGFKIGTDMAERDNAREAATRLEDSAKR